LPTPAPIESAPPNRPRSQKGLRTRARLLEAAKEIFEEVGFLEARISDIAERAGLSHGSFYHYFESKEEVFREVAAAVDEQLRAPMQSVILDPGSHASPQERIREALRRHLESYRREARIMGVIEQVSRYDPHVNAVRLERHREYSNEVADSIRQLQEHGLADPSLDPKIASAALGGMINRFPEMWLVQGFVNCAFGKGVDQLSRVFINALGLDGQAERPRRRTPPTDARLPRLSPTSAPVTGESG
jgi:AcrR family transcriptional regulator